MTPVLDVAGLTVGFRVAGGAPRVVVRDLSFELEPGRLLGLAGESGSGKSTAVLTAIGYPIPGSVRLSGTSYFGDIDLLAAPVRALRKLWGSQIAYVAQDASQSLSPLMRVETLLGEPLGLHLGIRGAAARVRALHLLESVGIPEPKAALRRYPHQFSGGQQQRIAIAIAMACEPRVLVLDEPTTGLDVTTQAQISELIDRLVVDSGTAAVLISHDLALLATTCDDLSIMYAGEVVERAAAAAVFDAPRHPYTAALVDAVPKVDQSGLVVGIPGLPAASAVEGRCSFAERCRFAIAACVEAKPPLIEAIAGHAVRCIRSEFLGVIPSQRQPAPAAEPRTVGEPLLRISDLRCNYRSTRSGATAVDDVSLTVDPGETVALVGESGSGKSTLLRALAGLHPPEAGTIAFAGQPLPVRVTRRSRALRKGIQLVFQDPHASLNPRHTVGAIIDRPLALFQPGLSRHERRTRVIELLGDVRLESTMIHRYPHQLSGGQKQRVALARAFAAEPDLILCDEVVSALDVSVQASILELLAQLTAERRTAVLFVTHDLAVVRSIADRVYVMRDGTIREHGVTEALFDAPQDDYTRELLRAVPRPHTSGAR